MADTLAAKDWLDQDSRPPWRWTASRRLKGPPNRWPRPLGVSRGQFLTGIFADVPRPFRSRRPSSNLARGLPADRIHQAVRGPRLAGPGTPLPGAMRPGLGTEVGCWKVRSSAGGHDRPPRLVPAVHAIRPADRPPIMVKAAFRCGRTFNQSCPPRQEPRISLWAFLGFALSDPWPCPSRQAAPLDRTCSQMAVAIKQALHRRRRDAFFASFFARMVNRLTVPWRAVAPAIRRWPALQRAALEFCFLPTWLAPKPFHCLSTLEFSPVGDAFAGFERIPYVSPMKDKSPPSAGPQNFSAPQSA